MTKEEQFVTELIGYIFAYPDDDYMTMECLCRKLHKYGLIDKKDGEWTTDFIDRKTENSSEIPNNCEECKHWNDTEDDCADRHGCRTTTEDWQDWKDRMWSEAIVTEPTTEDCSTVKPQNYCDDCLYCDTCDSKEFFYACTSKATISKMEQVDEPQTCSVNGRPYTDCCNCEHFKCTADEPQTSCKTCRYGEVDEGYVRCAYYSKSTEQDEPQLTPNYCGSCKHREVPCGDLPCDVCHGYSNYEPKDEPQTDCGDFADRLAYERGIKHAWEVAQKVFDSTVTFYEAEDVAKQIDKDINVRSKDEPQTNKDFKVTYTCSFTECDNFKNFGFGEKCIECKRKQSEAKHKDEPQTYITEDRDTQILDAWQVHHRNTTTVKDEPQTDCAWK